MKPSVADRVEHIIEAVENINSLLEGLDFPQLNDDRTKRTAFERYLEIISEASRYIPAEFKAENPQIPWRKVADFGNVLRHGYHAIRIDLLWALYIDGEFDKIAVIAAKLRNALPRT